MRAGSVRDGTGDDHPPHRRRDQRLRGTLLVLPIIAQALPGQLSIDIRRFMPDRFGVDIITTKGGDPNFFSPWVGMLILAIYVVVLLVIGSSLLEKRDA